MLSRLSLGLSLSSSLLLFAAPAFADTWASQVVSYDPGTNPASGFTSSAAAIGSPTRYTGVGVFPGAVTPFNPPFMNTEIVSLGIGGSLVVGFDQPVTNSPSHPFGIDLLVFGNAGYIDTNFPTGTAGGLFGAGQGRIEVSQNGSTWFTISGVEADGAFPTLGYADLTDPYATSPGSVFTDFTKPVNPAFNPAGLTFSQIVAGYAGSGGGTGVDIASTGLGSISFVRITNVGATGTVEIDAFSQVPAPSTSGLALCVATVSLARRRRAPGASR